MGGVDWSKSLIIERVTDAAGFRLTVIGIMRSFTYYTAAEGFLINRKNTSNVESSWLDAERNAKLEILIVYGLTCEYKAEFKSILLYFPANVVIEQGKFVVGPAAVFRMVQINAASMAVLVEMYIWSDDVAWMSFA